MKIGIPKEIKNNEARVALTPAGVMELAPYKHEIFVEKDAGLAIGFSDTDYEKAGAKIINLAAELYAIAEMIVKVKEPQTAECSLIREGQIIFSYLHLAAEPKLTAALLKSKAVAIAFETVEAKDPQLPLLAPMSEVAGRISIQAGAFAMQKNNGGQGILLGGVTGVAPAEVLIIGGGVVGTNAAKIAIGMGANVTILDKSLPRIRELEYIFQGRANAVYASNDNVRNYALKADLLVGAVLIPGKSAPKIITREIVKNMKKGSVIVDVAIDQGGCCETSKPTTHSEPTYIEEGVIHYCVTNMPAAVARTSTLALQNATLPYIIKLVEKGWKKALQEDALFAKGLSACHGKLTCSGVAASLNLPHTPIVEVL